MKITKRDGSLQEFNCNKIMRAIRAAGPDVSSHQIQVIVDEITTELLGDEGKRSVERIQDLVEYGLMYFAPTTAKTYILYRNEREKARSSATHPDTNAIGDYIHFAKYSRWNKKTQRRETWEEAVERVTEMHRRKYPQMITEINEAFNFVKQKKVLPSMRSIQFGGKAILDNHARMYNCAFTLVDRPRVFAETMYLLLCGCGVGYSVQREHISKLPELQKITTKEIFTWTIEDSIEGWADAVDVLISSYMNYALVPCYAEFNYSEIRPEGSELKTSGGLAPGHIPLKKALENIRRVLDGAVGRQLTDIEAHDIMCFEAEAVLSGGIRRSSLICLFSPDSADMMTCKTGDWWKTNFQRRLANNSAAMSRDSENARLFFEIFKKTEEFGEPGIFFRDNVDVGCNPCGEIGLYPIDDVGETGFAFCNLTEINATAITCQQEFSELARVASFIGTLQAGYTEFKYLTKASRRIAERDALLGVSITGMMDNEIVRNPALQSIAATEVIAENAIVANEIGINHCKRATTVKPSGTVSLLLGGVGAGIHRHHARRYFRRVTANKNEPVFLHFKSVNPHMCEQKDDGDWVITFPIACRDDAIVRDDMSVFEFMNEVIQTQLNWVLEGTNSKNVNHNVSCTIDVPKGYWGDVSDYVWKNREMITAMAFLPETGDKKYKNAPREEVKTSTDEAIWDSLIKNYKPVDYTRMDETKDVIDPLSVSACEGATCEI